MRRVEHLEEQHTLGFVARFVGFPLKRGQSVFILHAGLAGSCHTGELAVFDDEEKTMRSQVCARIGAMLLHVSSGRKAQVVSSPSTLKEGLRTNIPSIGSIRNADVSVLIAGCVSDLSIDGQTL